MVGGGIGGQITKKILSCYCFVNIFNIKMNFLKHCFINKLVKNKAVLLVVLDYYFFYGWSGLQLDRL
jgi:hypothetical protein